jgi:alkylation response protein AidB-like acyl-CoA dehydrogenase
MFGAHGGNEGEFVMTDQAEDLEGYRLRARAWLAEHMPPRPPDWRPEGLLSDKSVARARELLALLASGGFSGITWPTAYGGQGLTPAHEWIFNEEASQYEMPQHFGSTIRKVAETILEHGTDAQRLEHIPKIARGEELWAQYLSEPSGGSDLAGAITSAVRDGDTWVLNGSKIWTTRGYYADYALCLARTDWDVPKHQGLSMFIVPVRVPGMTVVPIKQVSGNSEFCQEFLDNVVIPADNLVGQVNDGWRVARTLLVHERNAFAVTPAGGGIGTKRGLDEELVALATANGSTGDERVRLLLAEAKVNDTVTGQLARRIMAGQRAGKMPGPAGSLIKLALASSSIRRSDIAMEIGGPLTVAWPTDGATTADGSPNGAGEASGNGTGGIRKLASGTASRFLGRQGIAIGGGTSEMNRNAVGERLLGLPREAKDDDGPYRLVRTNAISSKPTAR